VTPVERKLTPVENLDIKLRRTSLALRALDTSTDAWSGRILGDAKDEFYT